MGKIAEYTNWRVEVWPDTDVYLSIDEDICKAIVEQIKEYIDDIDKVRMVCEKRDVCEFCGREWKRDEKCEPLCCERAAEEWKSEKESEGAEKDAESKAV